MQFPRRVETICWLAVLGVFLVAGCAGQRSPDWKARIGVMTYDEALLELGPPNQVATLEDGTRVAEWLLYASRVYSVPGGAYGGWGPWWGGGWAGATVNTTPNVFLLLTFGPDQKLVSVRHQYK